MTGAAQDGRVHPTRLSTGAESNGRRQWSRGNQPLVRRVYSKIKPFKGARAKELEISWLSEDDFIDRQPLAYVDHGKSDLARDDAPIGHLKGNLLLFGRDSQLPQCRFRYPCVLASSINKQPQRLLSAAVYMAQLHTE